MIKKTVSLFFLSLSIFWGIAQDWKDFPIPPDAGFGKQWELQANVSDDFNYQFKETDTKTNFGKGKWFNFYHNNWDGPGTTYWKYNHTAVDGENLVVRASRWKKRKEDNPKTGQSNKMGLPSQGVSAGCVYSKYKVGYPVFVEARVSVANSALASDVWLLAPDDTQEIDIIECYGGKEPNNDYFSKFIHLSHHSFIRQPFLDYQPKDRNSWWGKEGISSWGEHATANGTRNYIRIGVYWVSPFHFEYYIDGELVRVLYNNAFATKINGTWEYTHAYANTEGKVAFDGGYQAIKSIATSEQYSFTALRKTSSLSNVNVIDPYEYQGGKGFYKEMDIIINLESQDWHVSDGRSPSNKDLEDPSKNTMKVDWIRAYKPVNKP